MDIGGHALKAVKITQASGGLLIEDADIIEYPAIKPDVNFLQSPYIKEALQNFSCKTSYCQDGQCIGIHSRTTCAVQVYHRSSCG